MIFSVSINWRLVLVCLARVVFFDAMTSFVVEADFSLPDAVFIVVALDEMHRPRVSVLRALSMSSFVGCSYHKPHSFTGPSSSVSFTCLCVIIPVSSRISQVPGAIFCRMHRHLFPMLLLSREHTLANFAAILLDAKSFDVIMLLCDFTTLFHNMDELSLVNDRERCRQVVLRAD